MGAGERTIKRMPVTKTEKGQLAFKTRSAELNPRQRSAFILFDGKRSIPDVLAATAGLGVTREDVEHMIASGMVLLSDESIPAAASMEGTRPLVLGSPQERYQLAYPIATRLTAAMGLRGFRLNLAVEAAGSYEDLLALAPRIREAVGDEKFRPLGLALSE